MKVKAFLLLIVVIGMQSCLKKEEVYTDNGGVYSSNDIRSQWVGVYSISCTFSERAYVDVRNASGQIKVELKGQDGITIQSLYPTTIALSGSSGGDFYYDKLNATIDEIGFFDVPMQHISAYDFIGGGQFTTNGNGIAYSYSINPGSSYGDNCTCSGNKIK